MKKIILALCFGLMGQFIHSQTIVTFYTTKGNFTLEIFDHIVPITGNNFLTLVDTGYYDGVLFHRVIDSFMIQGGDNPSINWPNIQDEFDSSLSNLQKTISMANTGAPNSGNSQFFINLVDNTYLDFDKAPLTSKHPVFGEVTVNFNVVQDIGKVATNSSDKPLVDVVIDSIRRGYEQPVGIGQLNEKRQFINVSPNPANATSKIHLNTDQNGSLMIVDAIGRMLFKMDVGAGEQWIDLPENVISGSGQYQVILTNALGQNTVSFMLE